MTNKEKFLGLVSGDSDFLERAKAERANRKLSRAAQRVAILILKRLKELEWTQKDLAEKMNVSPQLVNKWVKGKENNFSLDLLIRIGEHIGISLFEIPLKKSSVVSKSKSFEVRTIYRKNEIGSKRKIIPMSACIANDIDYLSSKQTLIQHIV